MRQPDADYRLLHKIADRVMPGTTLPSVTRTASGTSTPVYRIKRGTITLYLRLAESSEANLAPEVKVHEMLRARGVFVPEIVHFEPFNEDLGRSLMVTTEIAGQSLREHHHDTNVKDVLTSAGRDLARISDIPVDGFGWIVRDRPESKDLRAELPSLRTFAHEDLGQHLSNVSKFLSQKELREIQQIINEHDIVLNRDQAVLAHGDFDTSHIFHQEGRYTGIIDFGEIRGTDRFYDLGYVALHDGETPPFSTLQWILTGFQEILPVPPEEYARITLWSLILGVRSLSRDINRSPSTYQTHMVNAIRRALKNLKSQ